MTGFILTGILLMLLGYYLLMYFSGVEAPRGFMTLLSILLALNAVMMFSLGIIGEYLGRLFLEVKQRPQQVISLLVNDHRPEARNWLGKAAPGERYPVLGEDSTQHEEHTK